MDMSTGEKTVSIRASFFQARKELCCSIREKDPELGKGRGGGYRFQSSWEQVRAASIQKRWVIIDWKESMTQVTK